MILCKIWFKSNLDQVNSEGLTRRDWHIHSGPALVHMFYVTPTTAAPHFISFLFICLFVCLLLCCVLPGAVHSVISEGAGLEVTSPPVLLPPPHEQPLRWGAGVRPTSSLLPVYIGVRPQWHIPLVGGRVQEVLVSC